MIAALSVGLILALASALLLARILSRQVDGIVRTTVSISDGALADRVPVDRSGDVFDALGEAINTMLDRIEALVTELRLTTDGLAHDLKSPLTRLKSVLEQAMCDTRDPHLSAVLEKVAYEADTLLDMLTTALLISRTKAGFGRDSMEDVRIDILLGDVAEVYGPLVECRGFALTLDVPVGVRFHLNRGLVSQALGNLIENALNYAKGGDQILVSGLVRNHMLELVVADNGQGIAEDQRVEAMRRFGRLDPARKVAGSGLGLSLAESVARLHGGTLILTDNAPGLRVVLSLAACFGRD